MKKSMAVATLFFMLLVAVVPGHAKPGPDQDMSDFPPWIWPIIRTVAVMSKVVSSEKMTFEQAYGQMKEAVVHQCECITTGKFEIDATIATVSAHFDAQLAALQSAKARTMKTQRGMGLAMLDDDDWCGTPPKPLPWPPWILELVQVQTDIFRSELAASQNLSKADINTLDTVLNNIVEDFGTLLK